MHDSAAKEFRAKMQLGDFLRIRRLNQVQIVRLVLHYTILQVMLTSRLFLITSCACEAVQKKENVKFRHPFFAT